MAMNKDHTVVIKSPGSHGVEQLAWCTPWTYQTVVNALIEKYPNWTFYVEDAKGNEISRYVPNYDYFLVTSGDDAGLAYKVLKTKFSDDGEEVELHTSSGETYKYERIDVIKISKEDFEWYAKADNNLDEYNSDAVFEEIVAKYRQEG